MIIKGAPSQGVFMLKTISFHGTMVRIFTYMNSIDFYGNIIRE